ncbi:hypothetical protein QA612_16135 [Evansella sp. AB-P1]|uniref:hypothetical protein n=1 Tax=Evansella sp. AB-P1 TaxID=3037653 RepID=UPI00241D6CD5|nr:hypothetical protein [Evansella sp. AB-P1]MDG5788987.1 hypothetical protein [Evansella sp. AB-P1]
MGSKLVGEIVEQGELGMGEIDLTKISLDNFELEKKRVKNIREKTALLIELIDSETDIFYGFSPRPKFEVLGGHKIAFNKGANLNEVKVMNLYFRFRKANLDGTSSAIMYRDLDGNEIILLLPDDTKNRIELEYNKYVDYANKLVFSSDPMMSMNPDDQDHLIENLRLLTIPERCAQSLMHEYGHVLHWRIFDQLDLKQRSQQYQWFYQNGYIDNVVKRYPGFESLSANDRLYILKESFVEDYRIYLNFNAINDMFILPNVVSFVGDFLHPELIYEGVRIMAKMIEGIQEKQDIHRTNDNHQEPNRLHTADMVWDRFQRHGLGSHMSEQNHTNTISEFQKVEKMKIGN